MLHLANQMCDGNLLELSQRINYFFKSVSDHLPALSADNDYLQLEIPCVPSKYVIPVEKVEKQLRKLDKSKTRGRTLYQAGSIKSYLNCLPAQLPQSSTVHFENSIFMRDILYPEKKPTGPRTVSLISVCSIKGTHSDS